MKINSVLVNAKDNVITSLATIEGGSSITYNTDNGILSIDAKESVPKFHKVAIRSIAKGEFVIKYGEIIGVANVDIKIGQHVSHLNIDSVERDYDKESSNLN